MVMVRQVKLQTQDRNILEIGFDKSWDGKKQHFVERCDRRSLDAAGDMLSDAHKDASLK